MAACLQLHTILLGLSVESLLRAERLLALGDGLKGVGAMAIDDAAVGGIAQSVVDGAHEIVAQVGVVDRGVDLHTAQQIARHPVGRTKEILVVATITEDEDGVTSVYVTESKKKASKK